MNYAIFKTRAGQAPKIESKFDVFQTEDEAINALRSQMRKFYESKDDCSVEGDLVYFTNNCTEFDEEAENPYFKNDEEYNLATDSRFGYDVFSWNVDSISDEELEDYNFKHVY